MAYSVALFDADNTLMDFSRSEKEAISSCLAAHGMTPTEEVAALYASINDAHWKLLEKGKITRERLRIARFEVFLSEIGLAIDPLQMADAYMATLCRMAFCMDGAEALIERLSGHCRLFIITNGHAVVQNARFRKTPMARHFEGVFISEEIGYSKPDKRFFDHVASCIRGFDPRDTLVIGDSLSSDIQGGINAGLDTCWFDRHGTGDPQGLPVTHTVRRLSEIEAILRT